jgi:hypothetical protein
VVCARAVYHLKDEWLLEEVVLLTECDVQVDMPVWHDFLARDNPVERRSSTRAKGPLGYLHLVEVLDVEDVESVAAILEDPRHASGAHDWADHERVGAQMRDMVRVVVPIEGDGRFWSSEPCRGSYGLDGIHLLLGDLALRVGFIVLRASEDHQALLGLEELGVLLLPAIVPFADLLCRLLGLALQVKGSSDVGA